MKSSKLVILGMGAALVLAVTASAASRSEKNWSQWLQSYYQAPQPDQVVSAVFALSREGYFESAGQPATAIGFLSSVFADNPDKVEGWMRAFRELPPAHRRLVAAAYWYAGLPGGDREVSQLARQVSPGLKAELDALLAKGSTPVAQTAVQSESSLNLQWGAFLASGDPQYIVNTLAALGSGEPGLSSRARFALAEKAGQHARVYEICQQELDRQPAVVRDSMTAALAGAKSSQ